MGLYLGTARRGGQKSDCPQVASAHCLHPLVPQPDDIPEQLTQAQPGGKTGAVPTTGSQGQGCPSVSAG